jgi:hypothetical protein
VANLSTVLEYAAEEIRAGTALDAAELGVVVAAAADLLQALQEASGRLEVQTAEVPDLAAMHAWSLRLVERGSKPRYGLRRRLR